MSIQEIHIFDELVEPDQNVVADVDCVIDTLQCLADRILEDLIISRT